MDNLAALVVMREVLDGFRKLHRTEREYLLSKMQEEHRKLGEGGSAEAEYELIRRQYKAGQIQKLTAVKEVRNSRPGLTLKEAVDVVNSW